MRIPITRPLAAASMSGGDSDSAPIQRLLLLFSQVAYVGDETLDLVVRYFAFVCRHFFAHTIRNAIVQLRVRLLLHVVRVTYDTFGFVKSSSILRLRRCGNNQYKSEQQKTCEPRFKHSMIHFFLPREFLERSYQRVRLMRFKTHTGAKMSRYFR